MADRPDLETLRQRFTRGFEADDPDLLLTLLSPDCEWTIMPSGERFAGTERIRVLMAKVQAARTHSDAARLEIRDSFAAGDHICIEYLHRGVTTQGFEGAAGAGQVQGGVFEIDFCATALVRDGRIVRVREYFDQAQFATPPGRQARFFD